MTGAPTMGWRIVRHYRQGGIGRGNAFGGFGTDTVGAAKEKDFPAMLGCTLEQNGSEIGTGYTAGQGVAQPLGGPHEGLAVA
jgi:hypothetical protein